MQRIEHFICPSLCGCVIRRTSTWTPKEIPDDHPMASHLRTYVAERGILPNVVTVNETIDRCSDPAHQTEDGDAHWEEVRHIHGNASTMGHCKCRFPTWFDTRHPEDTRTLTLIKNPALTHACDAHVHLAHDIELHHKTAMADAHQAASVVADEAAKIAAHTHASALAAVADHTLSANTFAKTYAATPTPENLTATIHAHITKHLAQLQADQAGQQADEAKTYHQHTLTQTAQWRAAAEAHPRG